MRKLHIAIPKGKEFKRIIDLISSNGLLQKIDYFENTVYFNDPNIIGHIVKAHQIPTMVEKGVYDIGFSDYDWISNTCSDVIELLDTQFNKKTIFVAVREESSLEKNPEKEVKIVSRYKNIARKYLEQNNFSYDLTSSQGDSDLFTDNNVTMIIDTPMLATSFEANGFNIVDTILQSSLRIISNRNVLNDIWRGNKIDDFVSEILMVIKNNDYSNRNMPFVTGFENQHYTNNDERFQIQ